MKILNADQMRSIDQRTVSEFGIPSILLMENAAIAVSDTIRNRYPGARRVAIFCGTGQNGGDGLAIARLLGNRGVAVRVFLVGDRARFGGDALTNFEICLHLGTPIVEIRDAEILERALEDASQADLAVDAIFGTGLNRPPTGLYAEAIRGLQSLRLPIVAVDLPSGLNASRSELFDPVVRANLTVTFAQPKIAHIFEPASRYCGEIVVADISIPRAAIDAEAVTLSVIEPGDVRPVVPVRPSSSHKGTFGHVALVCGSPGRSGAAALAARGAIRGGAGLVTVLTDEETSRIVDSVSIESMSMAISRTATSAAAIAGLLQRFSAVLVGPGLADDEEAYGFVRALVEQIDRPLVLDASGLNAFQNGVSALRPPTGIPRVITPHPGELARLLGSSTSAINRDRIAAARGTASESGCFVVLKGRQSVVASPEGQVAVNPTGNPGMASGGMGDVLAGLLTALIGNGSDPFAAACAAVYLHGLAGDLIRDEQCDIGIAAMDVADSIPRAIRKIREVS